MVWYNICGSSGLFSFYYAQKYGQGNMPAKFSPTKTLFGGSSQNTLWYFYRLMDPSQCWRISEREAFGAGHWPGMANDLCNVSMCPGQSRKKLLGCGSHGSCVQLTQFDESQIEQSWMLSNYIISVDKFICLTPFLMATSFCPMYHGKGLLKLGNICMKPHYLLVQT